MGSFEICKIRFVQMFNTEKIICEIFVNELFARIRPSPDSSKITILANYFYY